MLWDYIFVGGGLSASVVSNRLHHFNSSLKILVIEAGGNANNDESVMWPNSTNLIGGEYDWKYKTVPQVALNNRNVDLPCGKALGGGTVINSGEEAQVKAPQLFYIQAHWQRKALTLYESPMLTCSFRWLDSRRQV